MVETEAKKPAVFKKFKRKTGIEPVVNEDNPFANSNQPEVVPQKSFVEKLNLLIDGSNNRPMTQNDLLKGVAIQFQAPKIIDWSESTGRFALAETVLKRNELEFVAMRQRMVAMAGDPDACGGRNERGAGDSVNLLGSSSLSPLSELSAGAVFGKKDDHKHGANEKGHCKHGKHSNECDDLSCREAA